MSTIKVTNVSHPSAASPAIVLDADGDATYAGAHDFSAATVTGAGGLRLVTPTSIANSGGSASVSGGAVTFTGVTTISLNGVFTSDYDNYRIICNLTKTSAGFMGLRLRASGTDSVTNYYFVNLETSTTGGPTRYASTTATSFDLGTKSNVSGSFVMDLGNPAAVSTTNQSQNGPGAQSGIMWSSVGSGFHQVAAAYDGFTLIIITGGALITGTIQVYGYQNS